MTTRMGRMASSIWSKRIAAAALAAGLMAAVAAPAFADEWHEHRDRAWHHWHRGWYGPHYVYEPYYYAPYYAPPPVVYAPPPPPPAYYYSPPPVVYAPPVSPSLNVIGPLHFR